MGFTPLGVGARVGAALSNGAVQAMCTATVEVREMQAQGLLKNAHLVSDYFGKVHMPFNGLATTQKLITENPELSAAWCAGSSKRYAMRARSSTDHRDHGRLRADRAEPTALAADYDDLMHYLTPTLTARRTTLVPDLKVRAQLLGIRRRRFRRSTKSMTFTSCRRSTPNWIEAVGGRRPNAGLVGRPAVVVERNAAHAQGDVGYRRADRHGKRLQ